MVIVMEPAGALHADIGSPIFGSSKEGLTFIGIKQELKIEEAEKVFKKDPKRKLFFLDTLWNKQLCHWPLNNAKAAFGFCEVM